MIQPARAPGENQPARQPRAVWLALLIAAGAIVFRVTGSFAHVVADGRIDFQGDGWYHIRAIEHLVRNFPHRLTFDPYAGVDAPYLTVAPLFDYLVAAIALAAGLGRPSSATVEWIAAVTPVLLGAASVLLVFALGSRLFGSRAGLLAAALLAVMPGPFLDRTRLGNADHHALEVTLVLAALCLLTAACDGVRGAWRRRVLAALAGFSVGAYFLTWTSAAFFAAALAAWTIAQFVLNRRRSRPGTAVSSLVVTIGAIALVMVALFQPTDLFRYRQQLSILALLVVVGLVTWLADRFTVRGRTIAFAASIGAAAGAAALAFGVFHLPVSWLQDLARFNPQAVGRTVAEMQPLFLSTDGFSLLAPWEIFRSGFFVGVAGLAALGIRLRRRPDEGGGSLVFVWSVFSLAATIGQLRFGYYLAPMLALLTGWVCSAALSWIRARPRGPWRFELAIVVIAAAVFYPSLRLSIAAGSTDEGMPRPWARAMDWLRAGTPDPFGDPETYFRRYQRGAMPRASYTVMSWWDYGYWILRAGRRVPASTPSQLGAADAGRFFTATTEAEATAVMARNQARYVVADSGLALQRTSDGSAFVGKFDAVALWAGRQPSEFYDTVWSRRPDGSLGSIVVFFPDYYRSMAFRLSRPDPGAVESARNVWVISYEDRRNPSGAPIREVVRSTEFAGYAEAAAHLARLGPGPHLLVGLDPAHTCVPLEPLRSFELLRSESDSDTEVRVFAVR